MGQHRAERSPADTCSRSTRPDPGDQGFRTARGNPTYGDGTFCYVDPKESEITTAQSAWIRGYLDAFETALYGPNFADPKTGYAKYIDVDCFIDHNLLNMLVKNVDALRLSTYMYKPRNGKLGMGPIWDFDRSLDSADGRDDNPTSLARNERRHRLLQLHLVGPPLQGCQLLAEVHRPLVRIAERPVQHGEYQCHDRRDGQRDSRGTGPQLTEVAQRGPASGTVRRHFQGEIDHLKQWLQTRCTWVDSQFVTPPQIVPDGGHVQAGSVVTLTSGSSNGVLYYTLDGTDPRPSGTARIVQETITLVPENAPKRVLVPTGPVDNGWAGGRSFDDSSWISGTGGVGFERSTGYEKYFSIDVGNQMYGHSTSCYIRVPFTVSDDPTTFTTLTLRMRYDDGFVAYLNGIEIARALFTGAPAWNSAASANHDDAAAVVFEDFDVSKMSLPVPRPEYPGRPRHELLDHQLGPAFQFRAGGRSQHLDHRYRRSRRHLPVLRADPDHENHPGQGPRAGAQQCVQPLERIGAGGLLRRAGGPESADQRDHVPPARPEHRIHRADQYRRHCRSTSTSSSSPTAWNSRSRASSWRRPSISSWFRTSPPSKPVRTWLAGRRRVRRPA